MDAAATAADVEVNIMEKSMGKMMPQRSSAYGAGDWKQRRGGSRPESWRLSIQDQFLNYCVREGISILVHLKNDSVKQGHLRGFDNWSLVLSDEDDKMILLFKSAVSAILPAEAISWHDIEHGQLPFGAVSDQVHLYQSLYH